MWISGRGTLTSPGCDRIVWDFEDGPFETVNTVIIAHARNLGMEVSAERPVPPPIAPVEEPKPDTTPASPVSIAPSPRRGRPRK